MVFLVGELHEDLAYIFFGMFATLGMVETRELHLIFKRFINCLKGVGWSIYIVSKGTALFRAYIYESESLLLYAKIPEQLIDGFTTISLPSAWAMLLLSLYIRYKTRGRQNRLELVKSTMCTSSLYFILTDGFVLLKIVFMFALCYCYVIDLGNGDLMSEIKLDSWTAIGGVLIMTTMLLCSFLGYALAPDLISWLYPDMQSVYDIMDFKNQVRFMNRLRELWFMRFGFQI